MATGTLQVERELTTGQIAGLLDLHRETVLKMLKSGVIRGKPVGNGIHWRASSEAVRDYLVATDRSLEGLDNLLLKLSNS